MNTTLIRPIDLLQPPPEPGLQLVEATLIDTGALTAAILDMAAIDDYAHDQANRLRAVLDLKRAIGQLELLQDDVLAGRPTVERTNPASQPLPAHLRQPLTVDDVPIVTEQPLPRMKRLIRLLSEPPVPSMNEVQTAVHVQRCISREERSPDASLTLHELTLLSTDVRHHERSQGRRVVYRRTHPEGSFLQRDAARRMIAAVTLPRPRVPSPGGWYTAGGYNGI